MYWLGCKQHVLVRFPAAAQRPAAATAGSSGLAQHTVRLPCVVSLTPMLSCHVSLAPQTRPSDEIDAIGTKRYDSHSGGEREIQRTMLELLNQMDGFDALSEVKVRGGQGEGRRG